MIASTTLARAAAESELLVRVRDELDPMPPGPDHAPLSAAEADLLERWIREGAPYEDHWAYRELERPEVQEPLMKQQPVYATNSNGSDANVTDLNTGWGDKRRKIEFWF